MDVSELYKRIASVTTRFEFTRPVESEDLAIVRQALVDALPEGFVPTVQLDLPRGERVLVEVWDTNKNPQRRVYARQMIV